MGAELGSDVAFFLTGGTAAATGRGEVIRELREVPVPAAFLLVWPGFSVSTREAYGLLRAPLLGELERLTGERLDTKIRQFLEIAGRGDWTALRNDFQEPVLARFPALASLKGTLLRSGCPGVLLAGSGSTFIGMGPRTLLEAAARRCLDERVGRAFLCCGIGRADYRSRLGLGCEPSADR
jgi:4-diphosphocytidyl-2-C-methyl-D-erythritol kinase